MKSKLEGTAPRSHILPNFQGDPAAQPGFRPADLTGPKVIVMNRSFVCSEGVEKSVAFSGRWNVNYTLLCHSEDARSSEGRCVWGGRCQRSREAEVRVCGRVCWFQGGVDWPSFPPLPSTLAALKSTFLPLFPWVLKLTPLSPSPCGVTRWPLLLLL